MKFLISLLMSLALVHYAHSVCHTVVSGNTCEQIEKYYGCLAGSIVQNYRGTVDAGCTNLQIGWVLCCTPITTGVVATGAVATGAVATGAVATGTISTAGSTCTFVQPGEGCNAIESRMGWALNSIQQTTFGINYGCTNLQPYQEVCGYFGGSYNVNNKCYTVVAGDTCWGIESKMGWYQNAIVSNNRLVSSTCNNLYPGQVICNYNPFPTIGSYTGYANYGCTTVMAGEGCNNVEARMGWAAGTIITAAGGAINSACTNMPVGARVCGYGYAATNTGTGSTGTGSTGGVIVGPIVTDCIRYTLSYAGQTCDDIARVAGVPTATLLAYNKNTVNCAWLNEGQKFCF